MIPNTLYCPECGTAVIKRNQSTQGSQLFVTLECMNNHKYSWQSQPMLEGMAAGNLLLSSSILLSGSTFTKVASLADILNLKIFSEKTFYNIQNKYLLPVINEFWLKEQNSTFSELGGEICGFQGMGVVTVLAIMQNMGHILWLIRKLIRLLTSRLFRSVKKIIAMPWFNAIISTLFYWI